MLVLVLALTLLIPELVQSFHSLYVQIEANIPRWTAYLNAQDADMGWLMSWLEGIDWEQLLHKVTASIDTVLVNAVGAVSATVNIAITASFALIISVYMSLSTESLGHQARTLVCAYLKPAHAAGVLKFCRLFRQSFANFLTGQCSEAVILGVLMALAFSVFKIPYGSLVGVLTAICAIIPYVGALISCVVSVFLVLLVDPVLAVRCLIVYLAVQFVENQFIYPRVVGKSVGLSPLYTLIAAMIGGKLFGIIGIIFFIPLTAVVIELVKEDTFRRLRAKEPELPPVRTSVTLTPFPSSSQAPSSCPALTAPPHKKCSGKLMSSPPNFRPVHFSPAEAAPPPPQSRRFSTARPPQSPRRWSPKPV